MRTTNRERVLMAMYAEHVNECGDFDHVRGQALGMESEGFIWAVMCLSREGLIGGVRWQPERSSNAKGVALERVGMHLTREGVQEAERMMELSGKRHTEKMMDALKRMSEIGASVIAQALSKALD